MVSRNADQSYRQAPGIFRHNTKMVQKKKDPVSHKSAGGNIVLVTEVTLMIKLPVAGIRIRFIISQV